MNRYFLKGKTSILISYFIILNCVFCISACGNKTEVTTNNISNNNNSNSNTENSNSNNPNVLPLIAAADDELLIGGQTTTIQVSGGLSPYTVSVISGGGTVSELEYTAPLTLVSDIILNVSDSSGLNFQISLFSLGGMTVWFDASSIVAEDGDSVPTWLDKSSNANDATQAIVSRQPVLQSSGVFLPNEKPILKFTSANFQSLITLNNIPALDDLVIFVVFRDDDIQDWEKILSTNYNTGYTVTRPGSNAQWGSWWVNNTGGAFSSNFTNSNWWILTSRRVVAEQKHYLYLNGALDASAVNANFGNTTTANLLYIGAEPPSTSYNYNGYMAEILIYPSDLTTSERELVQCYLANKYNLILGHVCP